MAITKEGTIVQILGIPAPPGLVAAMPRYTICRDSMWRRAGGSFCRLSETHGPAGLERAISLSGMSQRADPLYGSPLPYYEISDLILVIDPREAIRRAISSPDSPVKEAMLRILEVLRLGELSVDDLGLTGSLAMGIEGAHSDVDLIVYDEGAEKIYRVFRSIGGEGGWRRVRIGDALVSWTGASTVWHCPPLRDYFAIRSPMRKGSVRTFVRPRQPRALLYPPCVEAEIGYIVSFEFSHALSLYEGGELEIIGLLGEEAIYLGTREEPGEIRRARQRLSYILL